MDSGLYSKRSQEPQESNSSERPSKVSKPSKQDASQRHIKTEQARRDKIAAGFSTLADLLPGKEKVEKAMLLTQAADYISQLQTVLQLMMSSGAISKLPDDLQWQIRTLLPRKDGKAIPAASAIAPAPPAPLAPQITANANLLAGGLQLPFLPLVAQAPIQMADLSNGKDLPEDEGTLMTQVQALLQQQQQQAAAAQQIQSWQQALQALQLQQVLQQQQQQSHGVPDLLSQLGGFAGANAPGGLPLLSASSGLACLQAPLHMPTACKAPAVSGPAQKHPGSCYADELPRCGLQQLVDAAACEPSSTNCRSIPSPHKARKNVKVRRHTTAARIPKPDSPNLARVGSGRPEPV